MNYGQFELFFGPPGNTAIIPSVSSNLLPAQFELELMRHAHVAGSAVEQWRNVFAVCRDLAKKLRRLCPIKTDPAYLFIRTGILHPSSLEGRDFYGKVMLYRLDLYNKPLGPGQVDMYHFRFGDGYSYMASHWSGLPVGTPLPDNDPCVPFELRKAWFDGCENAPQLVQPVALCADDWEELL